MIDWNRLRMFHVVAEAGSFTRAGGLLNLSQSAISRSIGALEESLRISLFHRHARGLMLTEQGEALFRTVHEVFAKLAAAEAALTDTRDATRGQLRITTDVSFGSIWLAPQIGEFCQRYPDIQVHLILSDDELDLAMREADVAIRFRAPTQASLIQRRLVQIGYNIYGAPSYLQRRGHPTTAQDLDQHAIVAYGPEMPESPVAANWLLTEGLEPSRQRVPVLTVNNLQALMRVVESGLGIAALPDYMVRGNPNLVRVLPMVPGPAFDTYFVYPEELRDTKRIAVFRDFILHKIAEWAF